MPNGHTEQEIPVLSESECLFQQYNSSLVLPER